MSTAHTYWYLQGVSRIQQTAIMTDDKTLLSSYILCVCSLTRIVLLSEDPSNFGWNVKQVLHNWFLHSGGERKTAAPAGTRLTEHHILQPAVSPDDPLLTQSDLRDNIQHVHALYYTSSFNCNVSYIKKTHITCYQEIFNTPWWCIFFSCLVDWFWQHTYMFLMWLKICW